VSCALAKPKQMVRVEPMTIRTEGIDSDHLIMFTMLLVSRTQHYIWVPYAFIKDPSSLPTSLWETLC